MSAPVTVQLLGGACLRAGDTVLSGPPAQRHRVALLALVADAWPQPLARDRAIALLWPERDAAAARRLLNLAVHVLRGALGEAAILSHGDGLLLDPARVRCDLCELRRAVAGRDAERVVQVHTGPLLDGFHLAESAEFSHWLDGRRAELLDAWRHALVTVAERRAHAGDRRGAVAAYRRLVAADPHSADAAMRLMRALEDAGDRAAALQHAADHARRLREDLDLDPDPAVAALVEQIRRTPSRSSALPATSVAVLPFTEVGGGSADHGYFADGMTEDVIAHLSKIRALTVISRASAMQFRERGRPLKEIGRALGVRAVLDGTIRHAGRRVRIVATLVDVEADRQLWAETYDREITDIFAIQTDVALRIAAALEAELTPNEQARVRKPPTASVEAYQLYAQGRRWFLRYTLDSLGTARGFYERAIACDPAFALAHAALGMTLIELAEHGAPDPGALFRRAAEAAETALRLDPLLSEAHATLGSVRFAGEYDWAAAEHHLRRCLELNPGGGDPHERLGRLFGALGRYDEAIEMMQRAQVLDPLANKIDLATMLIRAGRYDEAVERARVAVEYDASQPRSRATLGWALFLGGNREEGLRELTAAAAVANGDTLWLAQLGEAHALAGDHARARGILGTLYERLEHGYVSPYYLAYVHTGLGEADRALDLLEEAVAKRTGTPYSLRGSFLFAPLRGHPRWRALMRTMNLE